MPVFLIVILIILAVLVIIDLVGAFYFFDFACRRKPPKPNPKADADPTNPWTIMKSRMDTGKAWIKAQNPTETDIISYDGLRLHGYIVEAEEKSDKVVLLMHGFRSYDFNDFSTSAEYFHKLGYNIVLPDERAHGKSEGKYICFGVKERFDCRSWIDFIIDKYGENCTVFLGGVSMGCATVTMTLGFDLPRNVKGCISDCGFTSPYDIYKSVINGTFHLPAFPFVNTAALLCKFIAGFGVKEYSTLEAMKTNKIPVLFIHGAKDDFVPPWMTKANYEACTAEKELLIIDDAEHAMSFLKAPDKCWTAIESFIRRYENS